MVNQILKMYDEHNEVWCLACDMLEKKGDLYKKRHILLKCYDNELKPHFASEERMFEEMELTQIERRHIPEIIRQHRVMERMFERLRHERSKRNIATGIRAVCSLLKDHIRLEEGTVMEHHAKNPHRLPFSYPDAGKHAPELVKAEIERYKKMPDNYKRNKPLLYHLLGGGTPPYKMAKQDANYMEKSPVRGQSCGNCRFAYKKVIDDDTYICSQMQGDIRPKGWCRLYKD
jgi:hemerythrin